MRASAQGLARVQGPVDHAKVLGRQGRGRRAAHERGTFQRPEGAGASVNQSVCRTVMSVRH
eukprot:7647854-Lingulodinium_polyedra.AAC.1